MSWLLCWTVVRGAIRLGTEQVSRLRDQGLTGGDTDGMQKVECRGGAKVPIVKCWDPELMLACDLNVNNPLALENTRMIKTYVQLDERIRPLAKIIKYWTKRRILNDAGE